MYNCIFLLDVKDYSISPLILVGIAIVLIIFIKGLKKKNEINNTIKDENVNMSDSQPIKNEIQDANISSVVNNSPSLLALIPQNTKTSFSYSIE